MIENPRNFEDDPLYYNEFGEEFSKKSEDWAKFYLD